jgi:hypothetical protein
VRILQLGGQAGGQRPQPRRLLRPALRFSGQQLLRLLQQRQLQRRARGSPALQPRIQLLHLRGRRGQAARGRW